MKFLKLSLFLVLGGLILFSCMQGPKKKVALCITATGPYSKMAEQLIESGRKHFLKGHDVTYVVFSDRKMEGSDIRWFEEKKLPWPYATLMRFDAYRRHMDELSSFDYVFAIDADMLFVEPVRSDILHDTVGVQHPGHAVAREGISPDYELNPISKAYFDTSLARHYYAGGFYGGSAEGFRRIVETCAGHIDEDIGNKVMARWHDETHLNCYFAHHPPEKTLTPSYCFTEDEGKARGWLIYGKYSPKILCLEKDHSAYQTGGEI